MPKSTVSQLHTLISELRKQRAELVKGIEEIDAIFAGLGISDTPEKRRGRPKGSGKKRKDATKAKAKRQKFSQTANEFVLGLVDGKSLTSAQVNQAWKKSGRKGVANNTLTTLTKGGKLKREEVKGKRGGTYKQA
ncbi:MAG: hypothetical protein WD768_23360 [Phycisphaeraceae bacterium]